MAPENQSYPEGEELDSYPEDHEYAGSAEGEEVFEYVDASELKTGAPGWVVALVALLALAVGGAAGAGGVLASGVTRESLFASAVEDAEPVATSICSGSANVRSTDSITGDIVQTLSFGDEVTGMLSGGWVKLAEGQYVSVSVLCDLTPAGADPVAATGAPGDEPGIGTDVEAVTAGPEPQDELTADGRIPGTFDAAGTGPQTIELPEDTRAGVITFSHTGDGTFRLAGEVDGAATITPALEVAGDFSGSVVFGVDVDVPTLTVDGTSWTLHIAPLDTAPEMTDGGVAGLSTSAYYLGEEPGRWRFDPTMRTTVVQYSPDGSTASAELTGPSEVELVGGGTYLVVYTAGDWTAEKVPDAGDADQDSGVDEAATTQAP